MDTKKLRQKILDLAIRGKLVPQDPNDEPASVLLERIRAEKERLIKEGKIKKSKASKTADTPHYSFHIPSSWEWTTLGELFTLQAGKNITAKEISDKEDSEHRFPCYGGNGLRGYVCTYNRDGRFPLIGRQGALCGNINFADGLFYATEHAVVVETYCETDVEWAVHTLTYLNLNQYATSTAQPGLSVSTINEVAIPLPPIKEQRRIVSCLNKWFALINKTEQGKIDLQTTIKQAKSKILDLAIHGKLVSQDSNDEPASELLQRINPKAEITCDNGQYRKVPFEIPSNWCWQRLGDINDIARGGSPRPIKDYLTDDENGINWIKIGDTSKDEKYINSVKEKIRVEGVKKSRMVHKGDFLLTNSMSFGRPYILNVDGCIHDGWLVISPKGNAYIADFLYYLLSSTFAYDQFTEVASGGVVTNLNSDKVADTIFPLPPLAEQKRIVDAIEKAFAKLDTIMESL